MHWLEQQQRGMREWRPCEEETEIVSHDDEKKHEDEKLMQALPKWSEERREDCGVKQKKALIVFVFVRHDQFPKQRGGWRQRKEQRA